LEEGFIINLAKTEKFKAGRCGFLIVIKNRNKQAASSYSQGGA
jgi:hypothetical protein